jgi:hypothetical protein
MRAGKKSISKWVFQALSSMGGLENGLAWWLVCEGYELPSNVLIDIISARSISRKDDSSPLNGTLYKTS